METWVVTDRQVRRMRELFQQHLNNLKKKESLPSDTLLQVIDDNFIQYFAATHELALLLLEKQSTDLAQMASHEAKSWIVSGLRKKLENKQQTAGELIGCLEKLPAD